MAKIFNSYKDASSITITLFSYLNFNVKFKTRLYKYNQKKNEYKYYHMEYIHKSKLSSHDKSINITPNGYILFTIYDDNSQEYFIMNESERSSFVRGTLRIVNLLEKYETGEVLGLVENGEINKTILDSFINPKLFIISDISKFGQLKGYVNNGNMSLSYHIDNSTNEGAFVAYIDINDKSRITMPSKYFCNLYHILHELNFQEMIMDSLLYIGGPEECQYETDLRPDYIDYNDFDADDDLSGHKVVMKNTDFTDGLESISVKKPHINKLNKW